MESLSGKVAVITGGTRGIGRSISERLLEEGAKVAICSRNRDSVEAAVQEMSRLGTVFGQAADVTSVVQVAGFFSAVDREFGGLDILVNNAGAAVFRKVGDMPVDDWRRNIDLNLNGPFYCSREALPRFARRGGGFIVNISSLAATNAFSGGAGYNAAKAGVNMLAEALLLDHRHDNVRVSTIMPGSVATEFSGNPAARAGDASWRIAPQDVAECVAMVLKMPSRTMVSRIEIRPSRPQK